MIFSLAAVLIFNLALPSLLTAQIEPGPCEWALALCVHDAIFLSIPTDYMTECLIGYAFCKKYIEA